jgi:hypothetical protein
MNPEEIKNRIIQGLDEIERQVEENFTARDQLDEALSRAVQQWASARALRDAITHFMDRRESSAGLHTLALFNWWRDELPALTAKSWWRCALRVA